jgi:hypothetical protein
MTLWIALALACPLPGPAAAAAVPFQDSAKAESETPAASLKALKAKHAAAEKAFSDAYRAAKTDAEREKLFETSYPKANEYFDAAVGIYYDAEGEETGLDAILFALRFAQSTQNLGRCVDALLEHYVENPKVAAACMHMQRMDSPRCATLLESIAEKNPSAEAQGLATLARALQLKAAADRQVEGAEAQAVALFEKVIDDYGGVQHADQRIGETASANLFELQNLGIGKPCPEIEGADVDGVAFKLSDYKGKVVFLDFWGFW